ncbi:MAG: DsbA family protein [Deltaproteobacteria bacterium]|nr:DsbA family protein [Deltaproteobacteria bacterium]
MNGAPAVRAGSGRRSGPLRSFDFWFDFSCPYAYLASTAVEALAARARVELVLEPMLLGGVFRAWGTPQSLSSVLEADEQAYAEVDRRRYAALFGVPLEVPPQHPIRSVEALRILLASPRDRWLPLLHAFFRAYWVEGRSIAKEEVGRQILESLGLPAAEILERSRDSAIKSELRRRTDRAIELGIFGAPSFLVGADLFWGQDRLAHVEQALSGADVVSGPEPRVDDGGTAELFVDPADPFGRVALREVDRLGIPARIRAVPLPRRRDNAAKERFRRADLLRQSRELGVEVDWERFDAPESLRASALALASRDRSEAARKLLLAKSSELSSPALVSKLLGVELSQAAIAAPLVTELVARARSLGVFASPTLVIQQDGITSIYAGADRFFFARRALLGDSSAR